MVRQWTILVGDDSVTTRTLERRMLEANSFMDGVQPQSALKVEQALAQTLVIMMTSRGSPDDKRRGKELGAGAYLETQTFYPRELLTTIGQVI